MMTKLNEVGFQTIQTYAEGHCHFFAPWQFLVAFKNIHTSVNWFRNEAEVELQLHQRVHRTKLGKPMLQYFDGHIMRDYQIPHKVITTNKCRSTAKDNGLKCSASKTTTTKSFGGFISPHATGSIQHTIPFFLSHNALHVHGLLDHVVSIDWRSKSYKSINGMISLVRFDSSVQLHSSFSNPMHILEEVWMMALLVIYIYSCK